MNRSQSQLTVIFNKGWLEFSICSSDIGSQTCMVHPKVKQCRNKLWKHSCYMSWKHSFVFVPPHLLVAHSWPWQSSAEHRLGNTCLALSWGRAWTHHGLQHREPESPSLPLPCATSRRQPGGSSGGRPSPHSSWLQRSFSLPLDPAPVPGR